MNKNDTHYSNKILQLLKKINSIEIDPNELINDQDWQFIINDHMLLYELLKKGTFTQFNSLPSDIFNNFNICLLLMNYQIPPIELISKNILENESFILTTLDNNYSHIQYIPSNLLKENTLLWFCQKFGDINNILEFIPKNLLTSELAKILVFKNGLNFISLNEELRNDINVYNSSITKYQENIFKYAGSNITSNPFLVSKILTEHPHLYSYIDSSLKNIDFYMRLLTLNPNIFQYTEENIKDNEHCVWETVKKSPTSLYYSSHRLLNTPSFALQICEGMTEIEFKNSFGAWGDKIKSHKETIMKLIPQLCQSALIPIINESLRGDRDIMLKVIAIDPYWFKFIEEPLQTEPYFFKECYSLILEQDEYSPNKYKRAHNLFTLINEKSFNEPKYLLFLYEEYKNIFLNVIYNAISHHSSDFIKEMKHAHDSGEEHVISFIEKIKLRYSLEQKLDIHEKHHDIQKI